MEYTPDNIADFFISQVNAEIGDSITPLKLQKLVYYAQAWSIALFDKPLFDEEIQAWMHGPVVPSLYHKFKDYTYHSIDVKSYKCESVHFSEETFELLNEIYSVYGELNAKFLEELTHSERPWIDARGSRLTFEICKSIITHESMSEFYKSKLNG